MNVEMTGKSLLINTLAKKTETEHGKVKLTKISTVQHCHVQL